VIKAREPSGNFTLSGLWRVVTLYFTSLCGNLESLECSGYG